MSITSVIPDAFGVIPQTRPRDACCRSRQSRLHKALNHHFIPLITHELGLARLRWEKDLKRAAASCQANFPPASALGQLQHWLHPR